MHERGTVQREVGSAAVIAVALFLVYAAGACPTIYVGDSGELVAAVYLLGIPHPTGYPLYVLLGKLWTLLVPFGSIAYRMSLFSAACAAAACAVLYWLCRRLRLRAIAALMAALLLGFSASFWGEANVQRVYSLNALFVTLATAAAFEWYRTRRQRLLALAFFLCGLGATNHTFMAVYAVALAVWMLIVGMRRLSPGRCPGLTNRRPFRADSPRHSTGLGSSAPTGQPFISPGQRPGRFSGGMIAAASGAFALGLLPYLYLPLRARQHPPLNWGDPETLRNFLNVILRHGFWERAWIEGPGDMVPIAVDYLRSVATELVWVGAALALAGLLLGRRRWRLMLLPVLVMAGNLVIVALHGSRTDIFISHRYYIPSYMMAALLAGLGCDLLLGYLPRALRFVPLIVPAFLLFSGWQQSDRNRYRIAEDYSQQVLRSLPPGAHLIATDENILFPLIYLRFVEHRRPDVDLVLEGQAYARPLRFSEPVFFTHHRNWGFPGLEIVPVGIVFRAWPRRAGQRPPPVQLPSALEGEHDPRVPKDYDTQDLIGQFHYMRGVNFEQTDWLQARNEFEKAATASPGNDMLFYSLGFVYRRNGLIDDAIAAFQRSHAINPRCLPIMKSADPADRLAELAAERQRLEVIEAALRNEPPLRGMEPGTAAYHREMAALLERRGEPIAARGHRLLALEEDEQKK
jgi:tetratricopeptide (TPR) repeat protein